MGFHYKPAKTAVEKSKGMMKMKQKEAKLSGISKMKQICIRKILLF